MKLLLSNTHRDNRLEWAKKNKKTDWSKIILLIRQLSLNLVNQRMFGDINVKR